MPSRTHVTRLAALGLIGGSAVACVDPELGSDQSLLTFPATELVPGNVVVGTAPRSAVSPYGIAVDDTARRLQFELRGGTDPMLYLAKDRVPTLTDFDLRTGFSGANMLLQTDVTAGEWYVGVRDVNLDIPFPAEQFSLVAQVQSADQGPLQYDLDGVRAVETSNFANQLQYVIVHPAPGVGVVDIATTPRFGSGDVDLYGGTEGLIPRLFEGAVTSYGSSSVHPGLSEVIRLAGPFDNGGTIAPYGIVALHGPGVGYENVIVTQARVDASITPISDNVGIKATGTDARHFRVHVDAGQSTLTIQSSGGTGASQLSVKYDSPIVSSALIPDVTADVVGADVAGKPNESTIVLNNPREGYYYIMLAPQDGASYTNVQLKARARI